MNVSHLAIGRAAEVIPCDTNLVTENKLYTELWMNVSFFSLLYFILFLKRSFVSLWRVYRENKYCTIELVPGTGLLHVSSMNRRHWAETDIQDCQAGNHLVPCWTKMKIKLGTLSACFT